MRVSSNKSDKGHDQFSAAMAQGKSVHVFLDGVEQTQCTMGDDELGEITRLVPGTDGQAQVDPYRPDEIWMETVTGKVEIVFKDRP